MGISARTHKYKERFHILGNDPSHAFDTFNRDKLLSVLKLLLYGDEIRLIRLVYKTQYSLFNSAVACSPRIKVLQVLPKVTYFPPLFLLLTSKQLYET